jgi:SAM-dependent methyltransferase
VELVMRCLGWALALAAGLACAQAQVLDTDVPFVVTPDNVTHEMLRLAAVKAGDFVIDLGSGDGRIVIVAARQFGARGLGVEIVPELVAKSLENARRAGVADRVEFRVQDLFATDLSPATVITMYLLPEVNLQLRPRLLALKPGTRIVSHDWDMGDWKPDRVVTVEAPDKPRKSHGCTCGRCLPDDGALASFRAGGLAACRAPAGL